MHLRIIQHADDQPTVDIWVEASADAITGICIGSGTTLEAAVKDAKGNLDRVSDRMSNLVHLANPELCGHCSAELLS